MLNFHHVQYFLDAAHLSSVSAAARKNHVSPSAVSQAIRQLEIDLETRLIDHQRNRFQLTREGTSFAKECEILIVGVSELKARIKENHNEVSGSIEFATQQSFAQSILPGVLVRFKNKFPAVVPKFRLATSHIVQRWIKDGEVDFGVTLDNVPYPACHLTKIIEGEFVFVSNTDIDIKLVRKLGTLLTGETPETRKLQKSFRTKYRQDIPIQMRIDSWGVIRNLAKEGLGVGLVPDYLAVGDKKLKTASLKVLGLPTLGYSICVVSRKDKVLSRAAQEFIAELQRWPT